MNKLKTTAMALTLSTLALALGACQATPLSQAAAPNPAQSTAIDQAIRANSEASRQSYLQQAKAHQVNHITYANVAYDTVDERQKMDIYLPKNHRNNAPVVFYSRRWIYCRR